MIATIDDTIMLTAISRTTVCNFNWGLRNFNQAIKLRGAILKYPHHSSGSAYS